MFRKTDAHLIFLVIKFKAVVIQMSNAEENYDVAKIAATKMSFNGKKPVVVKVILVL